MDIASFAHPIGTAADHQMELLCLPSDLIFNANWQLFIDTEQALTVA